MNYRLLVNGKLDDTNLSSEYERGYVDCFNKYYMDIWYQCMIYDEDKEWKLHPQTYEKYKGVEH